jgi:hypothetical protein
MQMGSWSAARISRPSWSTHYLRISTSVIGDEAGGQAAATAADPRTRAELDRDHHRLLDENLDLNKSVSESEASPPPTRPAAAPSRRWRVFRRPRGTSKLHTVPLLLQLLEPL